MPHGRRTAPHRPSAARAARHRRLHVAHARRRPVPDGVAGEPWRRRAGAPARGGYLGRPGLTAARFRADPTAQRPAPHAPHRLRPGAPRPWGRTAPTPGLTDHQLKAQRPTASRRAKVRGRSRPPSGVLDAGVVTRARDELGQPRLVAHLLTAPGAEPPAAAELQALAARSLPAPSGAVGVRGAGPLRSPRTARPTGPPCPPRRRPRAGTARARRPRTPTEEALAAPGRRPWRRPWAPETLLPARRRLHARPCSSPPAPTTRSASRSTPGRRLVSRTVAALAELVEEQVLSELGTGRVRHRRRPGPRVRHRRSPRAGAATPTPKTPRTAATTTNGEDPTTMTSSTPSEPLEPRAARRLRAALPAGPRRGAARGAAGGAAPAAGRTGRRRGTGRPAGHPARRPEPPAAAVLRAGAAVVPGPAAPRRPPLQQRGRGPPHRRAGPRGPAGGPHRRRRPARGPAHHLRGGRRPPGAARWTRRARGAAAGPGHR